MGNIYADLPTEEEQIYCGIAGMHTAVQLIAVYWDAPICIILCTFKEIRGSEGERSLEVLVF